MNIYNSNGTILGQIEIGEGSKRTKELGGEDNVVIYDSLSARLDLQIGDYVIIDGERFVMCEHQQPLMDEETGAVNYQLKLEAPYKIWRNKSYKLAPDNFASEVTWSNTTTLKGQMDMFIKNLEARHQEEVAAGFTEFNYRPKVNGSYNSPYTWDIYNAEKVETQSIVEPPYIDTVEMKVVNYDNISTLEALQAIADAWELEWWIDGGTIYFGRCEIDEDESQTVSFEEGENIIGMKPSQSKDEYATRLYAFGGTNNISGKYRKNLIFTPTEHIQQTWLGVSGYLFRDTSRELNEAHFDKASKQLPSDVVASSYDRGNMGKLPVASNVFYKLLGEGGEAKFVETFNLGGQITLPNKPGVYKIFAAAHVGFRWSSASYVYKWCTSVIGNLFFDRNLYFGQEKGCLVENGDGSLDLDYIHEFVVDASVAGKTIAWDISIDVFARNENKRDTFERLYDSSPQQRKENLRPSLSIYFTQLPKISCEKVYPFDNEVKLDYNGSEVNAKIVPYYDELNSKWKYGFWVNTGGTEGYEQPFKIKSSTSFVVPYVNTSFYTADAASEDVLKSIHEQRLLLPQKSDYERSGQGQHHDAASDMEPAYNGGGYIDIFGELPPSAIVEKTVTLDDIFPKLNLLVSYDGMSESDKVISKPHTDTDEAGNEQKVMDTYYRFKAVYEESSNLFVLEQQALIANELKVQFISGNLSGMTFGLQLVKGHDGMYEIVRNDDYRVSLPNETLNPKAGDKLIIIGWDTAFYHTKDITAISEVELLKQVKLIANGIKMDTNVYECPMETNAAYEAGVLKIGQQVLLVNDLFFDSEGRASRIIGYSYPLDMPYDNPTYSVGESGRFSRLGSLEAQIKGIGYTAVSSTAARGGESRGQSIKLITSDSNDEPTDGNVYSALRTKKEFLTKKEAESFARTDKYAVFHEDVSIEKGLSVGNNMSVGKGLFVGKKGTGSGIEGSGASIYEDAAGDTHIEADFLNIRKNATFSQITVAELRHVGGQIALSPASCVIHHVEWYDENDELVRPIDSLRRSVSYYRCYFQAEDMNGNSTENEWVVGDMARCQTFNVDSMRYYWWAVARKGTVTVTHEDGEDTYEEKTYHYIDFSTEETLTHGLRKYPSYDSNNNAWPEAGDNIAHLGHLWDTTRQAAILLSAYGAGAPSFTLYQGVGKGRYNTLTHSYSGNFTLEDRAIKSMYYDSENAHFVEITGKEGDVNGNWMKFSEDGLEIHANLYAQGDRIKLIDKLKQAGIIIDGQNRKILLQADTTEIANDLMIGGYTYNTETKIPAYHPDDIDAVIPDGSKDVIKEARFNPFAYGYTDLVAYHEHIGNLKTWLTPSLYLVPPKMGANVNIVSANVDAHVINHCDHVTVTLPFYAAFHGYNGHECTAAEVVSFIDNAITRNEGAISVAYDTRAPWANSDYDEGQPAVVNDEGSNELLDLFLNVKEEAMKYIGSRVVVKNNIGDPDLNVCFFGVKGIMFYRTITAVSPDYDADEYAEYEPWSRRVLMWKLTRTEGAQSISRKTAMEAISACRNQLLDEKGDVISGSSVVNYNAAGKTIKVSVGYPVFVIGNNEEPTAYASTFIDFWSYGKYVNNEGGYGNETEEWEYASNEGYLMSEGRDYYAPTLLNGEYFCLVCKADDGEIFWEIEDYGKL